MCHDVNSIVLKAFGLATSRATFFAVFFVWQRVGPITDLDSDMFEFGS